MRCPYCGGPISTGTDFCLQCGQKVEGTGKLAPNPDAVPWDVQPAGSKLKAVLVSLVVLLVLGLGAGRRAVLLFGRHSF